MKTRIFVWAGALLLYLVFLLATAPAGLLFRLAAPYGIVAERMDGTLWRGGAQGVSFGKATLPGRVAWHVRPWRLLQGELAIALDLDGAGSALLVFDRQGAGMRDFELRLPAARLASLQPSLEAWQPEGSIVVRGADFSLRSGAYLGQGEFLWERAALGISPVRPLGDYRGEFSGAGKAIRFQLQTRSGMLELQGSGIWSPPRAPAFTGSARARGREAELLPLLKLLGQPLPDGSVFF